MENEGGRCVATFFGNLQCRDEEEGEERYQVEF
jgi:hypothetical protein